MNNYVIFIANYNHHNSPLIREMHKILMARLVVIVDHSLAPDRAKQGWSEPDSEGIRILYFRTIGRERAQEIIDEAYVVLFDVPWLEMLKSRVRLGKLTFYATERWFKPQPVAPGARFQVTCRFPFLDSWIGYGRLLIPEIYRRFAVLRELEKSPNFRLMAKGRGAWDEFRRLRMFKGRLHRWGYFTDFANELKASDLPEKHILWSGRLLAWKRADLFVRAVDLLNRKRSDLQFSLVGGGPEEENLKRRVTDLGCRNLRMLPFMKNLDLLAMMHRSSCFVATSNETEGWGVVANEAFHVGCPAVLSDAMGCVGFLARPGIDCLVFKNGDLNDLVRCIEVCVDQITDTQKRRAAAKERVSGLWGPKSAAESFVLEIGRREGAEEIDQLDVGPMSLG